VNMQASWRVVPRVLTWIGVAALTCAAGATAYAAICQQYLSSQFDRDIAANQHRIDVVTLDEGAVVGRLEIPRLGISVMVLQGIEADTLRIGAGHVPGTPLPGGDGNVAIAAHRDTFFRKLEGIQTGDRLHVKTARGIFTYRVSATEVVDPEDTRVIESRARSELTLITCYPFVFIGAAPKRFIVHALPAK